LKFETVEQLLLAVVVIEMLYTPDEAYVTDIGPVPDPLFGAPPGKDHDIEVIVFPPLTVAVDAISAVTGKLQELVIELEKLFVGP
jgi:hypothetical protein